MYPIKTGFIIQSNDEAIRNVHIEDLSNEALICYYNHHALQGGVYFLDGIDALIEVLNNNKDICDNYFAQVRYTEFNDGHIIYELSEPQEDESHVEYLLMPPDEFDFTSEEEDEADYCFQANFDNSMTALLHFVYDNYLDQYGVKVQVDGKMVLTEWQQGYSIEWVQFFKSIPYLEDLELLSMVRISPIVFKHLYNF